MPGTWTAYQVIDDASRLCVALRAFPRRERSGDAVTVLKDAIKAYGAPRQVLSDNGAAFNTHRKGVVSDTEAYLAGVGVVPISGRPGHPTTQGKVERSHTGVRKWLAAHPTESLKGLNQVLDEYRRQYNTARPHQGLDGITPAQAAALLETDDEVRVPYDPAELLQAPHSGQAHVRGRGVACYQGVDIYLGLAYAGTTITLTHLPASQLMVHDHRGNHLATTTWPPPGRYVNLAPQGPRKQRKPRETRPKSVSEALR